MRNFQLYRTEDASGVSGTGVVAEGVEFTDGTACLRWLITKASTAVYSSMSDLEEIHGHAGRTKVIFNS